IAISGPDSWQRTYLQRSKVDAVMVGIGTVLSDDPQLTDRRDGATLQPIRIVVDTYARLPLSSKLVQSAAHIPVWVLCGDQADTTNLEESGVRIIYCTAPSGKIDVQAALKILGD